MGLELGKLDWACWGHGSPAARDSLISSGKRFRFWPWPDPVGRRRRDGVNRLLVPWLFYAPPPSQLASILVCIFLDIAVRVDVEEGRGVVRQALAGEDLPWLGVGRRNVLDDIMARVSITGKN